MKPFLFLGIRAEDDIADSEYAAVLAHSRLAERELVRVRVEAAPLPALDLEDWSGIVLGGGPFNVSDPESAKSEVERRAESELRALARRVVDADVPFLGACYGIGTLGMLDGGVVDRTHAEPIGSVEVRLTDEGVADPLFGVLPRTFTALLGHKEAVRTLPRGAVRLASSTACPVQAFRLRSRVYATQFHPELDVVALCARIDAYRDHGYFQPHEQEGLKEAARAAVVTEPPRLLGRFVELFAR